MVVGEPAQQRGCPARAPRPGSGGGFSSRSLTMRSIWVCIRSQSSTASRTSMSTLVRCSVITWAWSSGTRSISRCIQDSRGDVVRIGLGVLVEHLVAASRSGHVVRRTAGGSPDGSRAASSASAIDTESTRKGMSSVTTSTTVWPPADQPLTETLGVNTRTPALPWGRSEASRSCGHHRAVEVRGVALQQVLGGDVAVEGLEHLRQVDAVGRLAGLGLGVGAQRGEEVGLALFQRRHGFDTMTARGPRQQCRVGHSVSDPRKSSGSPALAQRAERRSHSRG